MSDVAMIALAVDHSLLCGSSANWLVYQFVCSIIMMWIIKETSEECYSNHKPLICKHLIFEKVSSMQESNVCSNKHHCQVLLWEGSTIELSLLLVSFWLIKCQTQGRTNCSQCWIMNLCGDCSFVFHVGWHGLWCRECSLSQQNSRFMQTNAHERSAKQCFGKSWLRNAWCCCPTMHSVQSISLCLHFMPAEPGKSIIFQLKQMRRNIAVQVSCWFFHWCLFFQHRHLQSWLCLHHVDLKGTKCSELLRCCCQECGMLKRMMTQNEGKALVWRSVTSHEAHWLPVWMFLETHQFLAWFHVNHHHLLDMCFSPSIPLNKPFWHFTSSWWAVCLQCLTRICSMNESLLALCSLQCEERGWKTRWLPEWRSFALAVVLRPQVHLGLTVRIGISSYRYAVLSRALVPPPTHGTHGTHYPRGHQKSRVLNFFFRSKFCTSAHINTINFW